MAQKVARFDRAAVETLSPVNNEPKAVIVSIGDKVKKHLTDIIVSVTDGGIAAPAIGTQYWLRIIVCASVGQLMSSTLNYAEFSPFETSSMSEGIGNGNLTPSLGNVYYDQIHILPQNQHIAFNDPIDVDESEDLVVAASFAVASGETVSTAAAKAVHLQISGWITQSVQNNFEQR